VLATFAAALIAASFVPGSLSAKDKGDKGRADQAPAAPATAKAGTPGAATQKGQIPNGAMPNIPTTLTKTMALESLITSMGTNGTENAQQTLEKVVTGEIAFGKHSQQAAQIALAQFVLHPGPRSNAFLLRMLTDPEDKLRVNDKTAYPSTALRADVVHLLAKAASPDFRLALARLYSQADTPPATRSIIAEIVKSPSAANFEAQLEIAKNPQTPPALKETFQLLVLQKNASAVKQALKLEASPAAGAGAFGAGMPMPGAMPVGAAGGGPGAGGGLLAGMAKLLGGSGSPKGAPSAMPGMPGGALPMKAGMGSSTPQPSAALKVPAGMPAMPPGMPAAMPAMPALPPGAMPSQLSPTGMALEITGQMLSLQPIDPNTVARELWKSEFVKSLAEGLTSAKTGKAELVSTLASVPVNSARNELKAYLHQSWQEGTQAFVKSNVESASAFPSAAVATPGAPATSTPAAASGAAPSPFGRKNPAMDKLFANRRSKKDLNGDSNPSQASPGPGATGATPGAAPAGATPVADNAFLARMRSAMNLPTGKQSSPSDVGADWLDPGSLVVLKTVPYEERPKEKPVRRSSSMLPTSGYGYSQTMNQSPAAQKRAQEKAEKQKAAAIKYDWRDAVHKLVQHLSERFDAVAEESSAPDTTAAAADEKEDKPAKADATKSKSAAKSASGSGAATAALGPAPTPSVAMPVPLHPGGKISKEFHLSWPQDLPGNMGSTVTDPLVVHYVRLEGPGEYGKALSHYRSAIKAKNMLREIENGKWIDAVVKDEATHRTRSVDIMVTREAAEDDTSKKSKVEDLKIEILVVEIASLEPDTPIPTTKPKATKKATHETTGTAHRRSAEGS